MLRNLQNVLRRSLAEGYRLSIVTEETELCLRALRSHSRTTTTASSTASSTTKTTIFAPCTIPNLMRNEPVPTNSSAAVCVLRISGPASLAVLETMTRTPSRAFSPNQLYVRNLYHPRTRALLDVNALVAFFRAPASFTGEPVAELHVHGSTAVVQDVIEALTTGFGSDVQPAQPGEFSRRAFYNGKMDLLQVESLGDMLTAETQAQKNAALGVYTRGDELVQVWRSGMVRARARVEAVIDFGEEDELNLAEEVIKTVEEVKGLMDAILERLQAVPSAEIVQGGLRVVLLGAPNVGKSSLLNVLTRDAHALVSPLPGTTRDVLERFVDLGGHKVVLVDGAGLRGEDENGGGPAMTDASHAALEAEGMKRIVSRAGEAHVVVVIDACCPNDGAAGEAGEALQANARVRAEVARLEGAGKDIIWVKNKVDLMDGVDIDADADTRRIYMSCRTGAGVDRFLERLKELVLKKTGLYETGGTSPTSVPIMYKARHVRHLRCAANALERFLDIVDPADPASRLELAAEELRIAATELAEITGGIDLEDVLDDMMTRFCIGK